jgi:RimJ/RimL family protein N-acetyltransferase
MTEIATARLILRPFTRADAEDLFTIRGDPASMLHWDHPGDANLAETRAVAQLFVGEMDAGEALYLTARLQDGSFVGLFDLSALATERPDLGFMVAPRLRGQGYGYEGAEAMVQEARRHGFKGVTARIHAPNVISRSMLTSLGFRTLGAPQPMEVMPGRWVDCETLALDF